MSELLRHSAEVFAQLDVGIVHVRMIAGEDAPVDLLAVVVRVIIAVPGSSDVAGRPVREESGSDFIFLQATREKILIVVPDPLQVLVSELHSGPRPELTPMALALLVPISESS